MISVESVKQTKLQLLNFTINTVSNCNCNCNNGRNVELLKHQKK